MPRFSKFFLSSSLPTKGVVFMHWRSFSDFKFIQAVKSYSGVSLACGIWYVTIKCPACYWFTCLFYRFSSYVNKCITYCRVRTREWRHAAANCRTNDRSSIRKSTKSWGFEQERRTFSSEYTAVSWSSGPRYLLVFVLLYRDLVALDI